MKFDIINHLDELKTLGFAIAILLFIFILLCFVIISFTRARRIAGKSVNRLIWVVKEVVKIYSNQPSFFSKKRIESGIAFIVLQCGIIYYAYLHMATMSGTEFFIWACINGTISGYQLNKIQEEKKLDLSNGNTNNSGVNGATNN